MKVGQGGEENTEGGSSVEEETNFLALNSQGYLGLQGGDDSPCQSQVGGPITPAAGPSEMPDQPVAACAPLDSPPSSGSLCR